MKQIAVRIKPISIRWAPRWDKSDKLFYIGKSWEASLKTLAGEFRCELESTRIQIGPIRIMLCTFDLPEHAAMYNGVVRTEEVRKDETRNP